MRLEEILIAVGFASTITLLILGVRTYRREIARALWAAVNWARGVVPWIIQVRPWQTLAYLYGLILLWTFFDFRMYHDGYFTLTLAAGFALVAAGLAFLWVREFLFLMALRDDDLPGRFDKPIWAAVLIALPPLGLYLFRTHRLAHWPEPEPKPRIAPAAHDLA